MKGMETLKALANGERLQYKDKDGTLAVFDINTDENLAKFISAMPSVWWEVEFEIYDPYTLSFAQAWEQLKAGKRVQDKFKTITFLDEGGRMCVEGEDDYPIVRTAVIDGRYMVID